MRTAVEASPINRVRRCLAEGRAVLAGDLAALLDRLDRLERDLAAAAGLRRKASRNRALVKLAGTVAPDLSPRQAARKLLAISRDDPDSLPPGAVDLLAKFRDDRMLANIIEEMRLRNEQVI